MGRYIKLAHYVALVGGLTAVAALTSCSDPEVVARLRELGEGCLINSDCDGELVCVFRRCHVECETTKDCRDRDENALCVKGRAPSNVCLLPDEIECDVGTDVNGLDVFRHNTCPSDNLRCARDGRCRDACVESSQCVGTSVCATTGVCGEPDELTDDNPITEEDEIGGPTATCRFSSQCAAPLGCRAGICEPVCFEDIDCQLGQRCDQVQSPTLNDAFFGACRNADQIPNVPQTCYDGALGETETDVDCGGGTCPRCASGSTCVEATDCESDICAGGFCQVPGCSDGVENANETGTDCGGPQCAPCVLGEGCEIDGDCAYPNLCRNLACTAPSCGDGVKNGDETSIDCGGATCATCADTQGCSLPGDCESGVCLNQICAPATCSDGVKNQDEPTTDCGGAAAGCSACGIGAACTAGSDCVTGVCNTTCQPPSCDDGMLNGAEKALDCGGGCTGCAVGTLCDEDADCASNGCSPSTGLCVLKHTLTIHIVGAPNSKVVSAVAGVVSCLSSPCVYTFYPDEPVTLLAIPAFGGDFQTFSGDCSGVDPCELTFNADATVTATFDN